MIAYLGIGILLAGALMVLLNWWANTDVKTAKSAVLWGIFLVCGLLALLLIASGKGIAAIFPVGVALWKSLPVLKGVLGSGRSQGGEAQGNKQSSLTIKEAYDILGLKPGATDEEILAAYRKLMAKCHPDTGGNDWMASKLNEAKDILLK